MRRSFTLFSIVIHTIVIAGGLYAQIVADSALPTVHRPISFDSSPFMPVEIQLPTPRVAPAVKASETVSTNAAPVVAPAGMRDETEREADPAPTHVGVIAEVESGPPSTIERLGAGGNASLPPPPPDTIAPIRLHSGMKAPVKTADAAPVYPTIAKTAHVQGVVILEAVLDARGRVESVRVLRSIPAARSGCRRCGAAVALYAGAPERRGGPGRHDGHGQLHPAMKPGRSIRSELKVGPSGRSSRSDLKVGVPVIGVTFGYEDALSA